MSRMFRRICRGLVFLPRKKKHKHTHVKKDAIETRRFVQIRLI